MKGEAPALWEELARRYDLPNQPEWQKLLNHFDLTEGFSLVVLLVLDTDGAALCRRELEKRLRREGKKLFALELPAPADLRELPGKLLATISPPETACLWVAAVEPAYSKTYTEWREAWQFALAKLNAYRNPIRQQFRLALTFVGAPWLQEVLREIAPDLWSVRTLVVRIEPAPRAEGTGGMVPEAVWSGRAEELGGGDPSFALEEAEKLRGVPGKELALARLLHRAGEGFAARNQWREADEAFTQALELKQRAGAAKASLLRTLSRLPWTCQVLGQARRSVSLAEQALKIAREIADRGAERGALTDLGNAYTDLGDPRRAVQFHERALVIDRDIRDRRGEGTDLGNLGLAYAALGDTPKAIELYEQALVIAREIGDRRGESYALGNLGLAYAALSDPRKAIEFYEQALEIQRGIGDRHGESYALGNLGLAYTALGDTRRAIEFYERALVIEREIGDRRGEGIELNNLGRAYAALGDTRRAIEFHEQALVVAREIGDRRGEAVNLWNSAVASWNSGDNAQAIARAEAALRIFDAVEDPLAAEVRTRLAEWRAAREQRPIP